jgi:hypothetical protein
MNKFIFKYRVHFVSFLGQKHSEELAEAVLWYFVQFYDK